MNGISKGPWALQVAPGDSAGAVKVISAGGGVVALMKAAGGRKMENGRAVAEVPAMVAAFQAIARQRDHFAEHGQYAPGHYRPADDQCFDDWAADLSSAILSRIDGAGDTLPDAPAPAPTASARDDLPALLSDLSGFLAGFDGCEFNGEAVESLQARIAAQVWER